MKFWSAADKLFKIPQFSETTFYSIAKELDLNESAFAACMAAPETVSRVQEDIDLGRKLEIRGTPTVFINGKRVPAPELEAIERIVTDLLETEEVK